MLKRSVIFVHRWLGVALCLLFLLWFPSGIGMMYWDFPTVTTKDRLARSPALDASTIALSPAEALTALGIQGPVQVRLNTFDGRPVYRVRGGRRETVVYADTGERLGEVSAEMVRRIAAAWCGQSAGAARVESIEEADQWTVQESFRTLRPLWKFSWPNGEQVYVSQTSGEVAQYTTRASRLGAYLGPIPHWIYFTPLRAHQQPWSAFVIWTSGVGTFAALLGIVVGLWMYSPTKRYRHAGVRTSIPYRGPKRWHMALGLIFGLGAATWTFSGMLSMDPLPTETAAEASARSATASIAGVLRGPVQAGAFSIRSPREVLAQLAPMRVKELELMSFAGEPAYLATLAGGETRVVGLDGTPRVEFDRQRIAGIVANASRASGRVDIRAIDRYDAYYLDRRRELPLPVILVRLQDAGHTRWYIDPRTARVVGRYNASDWVTRWLYHGLHSLDFPWLYDHRPAWDVLVITFMLGGTSLSVTSLILAWRVMGRWVSGALGGRVPGAGTSDEDLSV